MTTWGYKHENWGDTWCNHVFSWCYVHVTMNIHGFYHHDTTPSLHKFQPTKTMRFHQHPRDFSGELHRPFSRTMKWWLVFRHLKNDGVREWGWDDIPYMNYGKWLTCLKPTRYNQMKDWCTVMAMATSYNWLFLWDEKHSINGVFLVLITDKWP